jgi:hypothetical protein
MAELRVIDPRQDLRQITLYAGVHKFDKIEPLL